MFPAPYTNPWISTDNPSADKAAIVTALTNPAPLGIQTFYKMYVYIYILIYPYFKYICSCICFECRRLGKEYMRIICSCPKFEVQTQNPHSRHRKSLFLSSRLDHPLHFKKSFIPKRVLLTSYKSAFSFSSVSIWAILHQGFFFVKQMLLDSNACISEWFFISLLAAVPTLMIYFFAFGWWSWCNYNMA